MRCGATSRAVRVALAGAAMLGVHAAPAAAAQATGAAAATSPPNVVVIVTDDQRADQSLDVMPKTRSWLQQAGRTFTNAEVTTPSCCPSRSSILSGRYVHNTHVFKQALGGNLNQRSTIERYLQGHGYFTAMAGKFLNSWKVVNAPPFFDRFALFHAGYFNAFYNVNGLKEKVPEYSTTFLGRQARRFVANFDASDDARPFYLYFAPYAPHLPSIVEPKHEGAPVPPARATPALADDPSDKPPYIREHAPIDTVNVRRMRQRMLRTLISVDDQVDLLMRQLRRLGELSNTLVIYTSDNGFAFGEHHWVTKFTPYPESVGVPLLMRWDGRIAPGSVDGRLAANIDIVPTIMDVAGVTPDAAFPLDGHSLLGPVERTRLLLEYFHDEANEDPTTPLVIPSWASLRATSFQYVEDYAPDGSLAFREYYDLGADPWETTNLLADGNPSNDPDVAALSAQLARDRTCAGADCP